MSHVLSPAGRTLARTRLDRPAPRRAGLPLAVATAALGNLAFVAAIDAFAPAGLLRTMLHPLYAGSLLLASGLAALCLARTRVTDASRPFALVGLAFVFQVAIVSAWNAGVFSLLLRAS